VNYARLASLLRKNAKIHATKLSEDFDFAAYLQQHGEQSVPLFAVDTKGRLRPFTLDQEWLPEPGWTVIGLISPDKQHSA
jgi:hypothetical protein